MAPMHTSQEWDRMRPYVQQLYVIEDRKLNEVRQIMEAEHQFVATARMYKQRIKHWGMQGKNLQRPEWRALDAICRERKEREGKDTIFYVTKCGMVHRKLRADIEKHYKRDTKAQMTMEEAQAQVPEGIRIDFHTPTGSPASSPQPRRATLNQIRDLSLNTSDSPVDEQGRDPATESPLRSETYSSSSSEAGPSLRRASSESGLVSPIHRSSNSNSWIASPPSRDHLTLGFRALALKLCQPGRYYLSQADELAWNQLLCGTGESEAVHSVDPSEFLPNSDNFGISDSALDQRSFEACEWAASLFRACYWNTKGQPDMVQSCRDKAMSLFRRMRLHANDNVHTGLSWLVAIIGSHGHEDLLKGFLQDCCNILDNEVGHNLTFTPLYRYTLATVSDNRSEIMKYGSELFSCQNYIRTIYGQDSPNYLISSYYVAYHRLELGEIQHAVAWLEHCLPLSERLMGKNHLVTINCMNILHRAYIGQGQIERGVALLVDAIERAEPALGKQSPYRLDLLNRLATAHKRMGQADLAQNILREVLDDQIKLMGFNSRTEWTFDELRRLLDEQGKITEANALMVEMQQRYEWAWTHSDRRRRQEMIEVHWGNR